MFSVILKLLSPVTTCVIALIQYFRTKKSETPWFKEILVWIFIGAFIISTSTILSDYNTQKELKKQNVNLLTNLIIMRGQNDSLITKNDSLIKWMADLKTSANHQDTISEESLKYKINTDKPKVILSDLKLTDEYTADSIYKPNITFAVTNIGKRIAEKLSYRTWIVSSDLTSSILTNSETLESLAPNPAPSHGYDFNPILKKKILPIYLCMEIMYYDKQTHTTIIDYYFREYRDLRWYFCDNVAKGKMINIINEHTTPKIKP